MEKCAHLSEDKEFVGESDPVGQCGSHEAALPSKIGFRYIRSTLILPPRWGLIMHGRPTA